MAMMADDLDERPEPANERDAVNDAVRDAISSLKGDAPEPEAPEPEAAAAAVLQPAEQKDGPARDATGKFAPKDKTADAAPAKAAAPQPKSPTPEDGTKPSAEPSKAVAAPVTSWSADAKQAWASLPPAVQAAVVKREQEVSAGFRQYSEQTKQYERMLTPLAQESQRFGLNVEQGLQRLLDGQRFLETQPAQAIMWLAQRHGLNLAEIAANPPAPQPARSEPTIPPQFVQHISGLEERLNGILMDQNMSALEQFAANPSNRFYADVEDQLPDIMRQLAAANPGLKGVPLLQKAYDQAIWLDEGVRSRVIAEQTQQTTQAATQKVAEKAARATKAAVSIKGSSADTRPPPKAVNGAGHVTDDVRAAIEQLRAQ